MSEKSNLQDEKSSFGSRVKRYGQVTGAMAGLATKLAGQKYFGRSIEKEEHAQELLQVLGGLKGPIMKVGQILATVPEALPPEYADAMRQLQSNAPPMGWPFVKRRMKGELGADWQSRFKSFGKDAAAAASLGQVHKAVLPDGRDVACKLQYPDMASSIEADLNQLKLFFSLFEKYDRTINTAHIHEELSARLREELDYKLEAKFCKLYGHMLSDEKGVHVPDVIDDFSTDRLLCTSWMDGRGVLEFIEDHGDVRSQIAMNMFRAWYVPLYYYGVIHGDPHLGNYSVREDYSLNLLDFGCVRVFPSSFVAAVIDLYQALLHDKRDLAVHAFESWGFKDLSNEHIDTLMVWAGFLYGPLLEDKVRPIGEVKGGIYGRETAQEVHKRLRELGRITIPREFVFMDRAALGLGSVFLHLKAEINWYQVFHELISDFDAEAMARRQETALGKFGLLSDLGAQEM